jgi:drug/metabolite transporter (DMT)-like permease
MAKRLIWIFLIIALLIYIFQITSAELYKEGRPFLDGIFWVSLLCMVASYFWYRRSRKNE